MANKQSDARHADVSLWAKRCYFAGRAAMETVLRPHGLGASQFYVLYHLAQHGPTPQRDLIRLLQVERATMSIIVAALVRKDALEQVPDPRDQRQKLLRLTDEGARLLAALPDLTFIRAAAFDGIAASKIDVAIEVLRTATERLERLVTTEVEA